MAREVQLGYLSKCPCNRTGSYCMMDVQTNSASGNNMDTELLVVLEAVLGFSPNFVLHTLPSTWNAGVAEPAGGLGSATRPANRMLLSLRSWMNKRNGWSALKSIGCGLDVPTDVASMIMAVTAAASVPNSSTAMKVLCKTFEMNSLVDAENPEKSAASPSKGTTMPIAFSASFNV
mmetsp:Transcript_109654/g.210898  ORF Transcript_109654/g.210898 Transcript_109654/m.210898 type:complete len:176 (-) Transcript_109654:375-902(-)